MNENGKWQKLLPCSLCKTVPRRSPVYLRVEGHMICKHCYGNYFESASSTEVGQKAYSQPTSIQSNAKHQVYDELTGPKVDPRCNPRPETPAHSPQHTAYKINEHAHVTPPTKPPIKILPKTALKLAPPQTLQRLPQQISQCPKVNPDRKYVERQGPRNREEWRQMLLRDKQIIESRSLDWKVKEQQEKKEFRMVNSEPNKPRPFIQFEKCCPAVRNRTRSFPWTDPEVGRITQQYPPCPSTRTTTRRTIQERTPQYRVFEEFVAPSETNLYGNDVWFHDVIGAHPVSRRPINCPITDCESMVAMPSLMAHFSCEHPRIAFLAIDPDSTRPLAVNVNAIPYNITKCIALLLLEGQKMSCNLATYQNSGASVKMANLDKYKNYLPLPLMVCRLRSKKLFQSFYIPPEVESIVDLNKVLEENQNTIAKLTRYHVSPKTRGTLTCTIPAVSQTSSETLCSCDTKAQRYSCQPSKTYATEKYTDTDFVFIWLCGVDSKLPVTYTITAFDTVFQRHSSFRGPLHTLRETQNGWYIFHNVDCMIIHQSLAHGLSNRGAHSIELEVTIGRNRDLTKVCLR